MPFEIPTPTAAKLNTVTPRKEMHGDEPVSAVSLGLSITGPNTLLDHLDGGKLRNALYMAVPDQEQLPGVEPATPLLRARGIEVVSLNGSLEGWTVGFEHGIDEGSAIVLGSSKVDKFRVKPMEGGSVELLFRVGTSDISEEEAGALFGKLGQEVMISLKAPVKAEGEAIDGTVGHPGAAAAGDPDAGDLFADQHAGDFGRDDDSAGPGAGSSDDVGGEPERGENWPFPQGEAGPVDGAADSASNDEAAALEAGMAQAMAAAGLQPKAARRGRRIGGAE